MEDTTGIIKSINTHKQIVTINVDIFGRETPVRLVSLKSEKFKLINPKVLRVRMVGGNPDKTTLIQEVCIMARVTGYIKLQIPAGKATPAPPVGPALGQHGVNIVQFTKEFNARTATKME